MSLVRISFVGCMLLAGLLSGCGDGPSGGEPKAPPADSPNAGEEASKKIMDMAPPAPGKKAKG